MTSALVEHFFRHEYGRLVAILSCQVGVNHIEAVEDAVQLALMKALELWTRQGTPDNPPAWLLRVASNALLGELRQHSNHRRILEKYPLDLADSTESMPEHPMAVAMQDDLLRMLFVCCDDSVPLDSQIVFALKTLCGFNIGEIALRLFTSEANVYKRLARARHRLRQSGIPPQDLNTGQHASRLHAVHRILYVLFTEGYLCSHAITAIRRELCVEAIRLTHILAEHPVGQTPRTFALLALMHLHTARITTRQDAAGGLLLLEEQDRTQWDQKQIQQGLAWLARSADGDEFSRYHAEAGIAAEHCLAPSFDETRWETVVDCYLLLEKAAPSALHKMNRAIAVAEWQNPAAGLAILAEGEPPDWLIGSCQWATVQADLLHRCGQIEQASHYRNNALDLAPSHAIKTLLKRRFNSAT